MYTIFINGREVGIANSEGKVWEIIGKFPFGSLYEVRYTESGEIANEFVPF